MTQPKNLRHAPSLVTNPRRNDGEHGPGNVLPHHRLVAYQLLVELARLVASARITDARLREQARKGAASAALNCAEGAARESRADKNRVFAIARAECCEAAAAVEVAGALGACRTEEVRAVLALAARAKDVLAGLMRGRRVRA